MEKNLSIDLQKLADKVKRAITDELTIVAGKMAADFFLSKVLLTKNLL